MIYFLVDEQYRVQSFGYEEYLDSIGVPDQDLVDGWYELFNERRLGLYEGVLFHIPREDDEEVIAE